MKILFLHPNMPGQYKHVVRACAADPSNQLVFLTNPGKPDIPGVSKVEYAGSGAPDNLLRHLASVYMLRFAGHVTAAEAVWRACERLKRQGFVPDVIVAHLGWGSGLFLRDAYPRVPILNYAEFYFHASGADRGFLPGDVVTPREAHRLRLNNAAILFGLTESDWCVTPTFFQRDAHPAIFHPKISILHDGVDARSIRPDPEARYALPDGRVLTTADEVVTYVSPVLEAYRGFPQFMEAASLLMAERPRCHVVVVGQERGSGYGHPPAEGQPTCLQDALSRLPFDRSRLHILGPLAHQRMVRVMQVSSAHVYLTVPFVLSWSMIEAMAAGCLVVGSDTAPVREVIEHGRNGLLVDMLSPAAIAGAVSRALDDRGGSRELRRRARETVLERYALRAVMPGQLTLIRDVATGKIADRGAWR